MSDHPLEKNTPKQPTGNMSQLQHLSSLLVDENGLAAKSAPPLEKWNPPDCGDMDLTIKANGQWWHEGTKMTRQTLINLFATVLWREDNTYYLKTPVEKIRIKVEDAPLLVTMVDLIPNETPNTAPWIKCTTQTGDMVIASIEHPIFFAKHQGETRPYINIRRNLNALIHRNAFFHLMNWGELTSVEAGIQLTLPSGDHTFTLLVDESMDE